MKRLLLAAALTLFAAAPAMAQTVILVRHAEKADQSSDPVLSSAGEARARALVEALPAGSVDHIFVTPLQRTRLTAAPTAAANGVAPVEIGFDGGAEAHIAAVAERVRALPDDATVLLVGHSNTVPLIARALGARSADMADCEYDRLTILTLGGGSPVTINSQYGQPSTCE